MDVGDSERVQGFVSNCDGWGADFVRYARSVVSEVVCVGRAGTLVLWDGCGRPVVSLWRAEDILDWAVERAGERVVLSRVVLRDGEQIKALRMVEPGEADGTNGTNGTNGARERVCVVEVWRRTAGQGDDGGEWELAEMVPLKRDGKSLSFVPFVFHGPRDARPDVDRLPMADIIAANLDHYRLDADYKHGLHFAALPTAWVCGFDKATALRIGSSAAWVSEVPGATAGFLEFSGSGLGHLERAMEEVERRMALLGARGISVPATDSGVGTGVPATTGVGTSVPATVGESGELCGLGSIVAALNESLSRVLQLARWWVGGGELDALAGKVSFAMNTDLGARPLSGQEIAALVTAWRAGGMSRESMLARFKRGEVLPDGRTVEQEVALIHGKT